MMQSILLRPGGGAAASLAPDPGFLVHTGRSEASWPRDAPQIISSCCVVSAGARGRGGGHGKPPPQEVMVQKAWLQAEQVGNTKAQYRKECNVFYLLKELGPVPAAQSHSR